MMRIITGTARGIRLSTLEGDATRPTTEMAKEGIFSAIQFDLDGAKVLDLFAGSGQLGLEALSRGAAAAVFVDSSQDAIEVIRSNAQKTKLQSGCRIIRSEYGEYIKNASRLSESFDFIFVDPPYASGITAEVAKRLFKGNLVKEGGAVICETDNASLEFPDEVVSEASEIKHYHYGKTHIYLIRRKTSEI